MTSLIPKVIFCLDAENITRSGSSSKANQNTTAAEVHAIDESVAQNDTIAHKILNLLQSSIDIIKSTAQIEIGYLCADQFFWVWPF